MRQEQNHFAIVGGPADGRMAILEPGCDRLEVYNGPGTMTTFEEDPNAVFANPVEVKTFTYVADGMTGKAGWIPILRPADWDMSQVFLYLLHERQQTGGTRA